MNDLKSLLIQVGKVIKKDETNRNEVKIRLPNTKDFIFLDYNRSILIKIFTDLPSITYIDFDMMSGPITDSTIMTFLAGDAPEFKTMNVKELKIWAEKNNLLTHIINTLQSIIFNNI